MDYSDIILDVCYSIQNSNFYVGEAIPMSKLQRASSQIGLPPNEQVIALVDNTVLGSAKNATILTKTGIYIKNDWTSQTKLGYISWEDFIDADLSYTDKFTDTTLWINNLDIGMAGAQLGVKDFYLILARIQERLTSHAELTYAESPQAVDAAPPPPPVSTTDQWRVTMNGEQYGPYDTETIGQMMMNDQLKSDTDYVWKQGMPEWVLIKDCEPLQKFLAPPAPATPPTPPPVPGQSVEATDEPYEEININTAEIGDLLRLPFLTLEKANALLLKRQELGRFSRVEEVQTVLQLQPHEFEELKKYLNLDDASSPTGPMTGRIIDY